MGSKASVVTVLMGLILLALCVGWTQYLDRDEYWWSDEQANEYAAAGNEVHRLTYTHYLVSQSRKRGRGP